MESKGDVNVDKARPLTKMVWCGEEPDNEKEELVWDGDMRVAYGHNSLEARKLELESSYTARFLEQAEKRARASCGRKPLTCYRTPRVQAKRVCRGRAYACWIDELAVRIKLSALCHCAVGHWRSLGGARTSCGRRSRSSGGCWASPRSGSATCRRAGRPTRASRIP
eukprot:1185403-Prorocentrum_minimum.AAC.4